MELVSVSPTTNQQSAGMQKARQALFAATELVVVNRPACLTLTAMLKHGLKPSITAHVAAHDHVPR